MHDVLEEVLQYEAKEFIKYAINEQKVFSLEHQNQWIKNFDFDYAEAFSKSNSKPPNKLIQTERQVMA